MIPIENENDEGEKLGKYWHFLTFYQRFIKSQLL